MIVMRSCNSSNEVLGQQLICNDKGSKLLKLSQVRWATSHSSIGHITHVWWYTCACNDIPEGASSLRPAGVLLQGLYMMRSTACHICVFVCVCMHGVLGWGAAKVVGGQEGVVSVVSDYRKQAHSLLYCRSLLSAECQGRQCHRPRPPHRGSLHFSGSATAKLAMTSSS